MSYQPKTRNWRRAKAGWREDARKAIEERDGGHCVYCGDFGSVIDHVLPIRHGGPTIRANGVLACSSCNTAKTGNLDIAYLVTAFYHLLQKGESLKWLDALWNREMRGLRTVLSSKEGVAKVLQSEVSHEYVQSSARTGATRAKWE